MISIIIGIVRKEKITSGLKYTFFCANRNASLKKAGLFACSSFLYLYASNVACSSLFSLLSLPDGFGQGESKVVKLRIGAKIPPFHLAPLVDPNTWPVLLPQENPVQIGAQCFNVHLSC